MNMKKNSDKLIDQLNEKNRSFQQVYSHEAAHHINGQKPKIAIITCSDSRVVPEFIFQAKIGELFVVRVAGNIALDDTVIESLEYAVNHLHVSVLLILAHTDCGAIHAAENAKDTKSVLLSEIQKSFPTQNNHILANLNRQLQLLPQRSESIKKAIEHDKLQLKGAIYHIKDGHVDFID